MNDPTMETLVQRVDRLERAHRRWKRTAAALAVGIAALVLMGQATLRRVPKVIEAERFVLRDGQRQVRAELAIQDGDFPELAMYDRQGTKRVRIDVLSEVPHLVLSDKEGGSIGAFAADNMSALRLSNNHGTAMLVAGFGGMTFEPKTATFGPYLQLTDKSGQERLRLGVATLIRPSTGVVEERPESSVVLFDKDGKVIWKAP